MVPSIIILEDVLTFFGQIQTYEVELVVPNIKCISKSDTFSYLSIWVDISISTIPFTHKFHVVWEMWESR